MSRFTFILAAILLTMSGSATAQELPKEGILIKMEDHELVLNAGKAQTKVYFLRSKRLRKVKLQTPAVQTQEGLDVTISPIADEKDAFLLTVKADGSYDGSSTLMIDGTGRWGRDTKSTSFTVISNSSPQISKNQ